MKKTRWIRFLGGIDLIFTLIVIILLCIAFLLFSQIDYVFTPIIVLVSSILMPFIIALFLYYVFNPVIDFLEQHGIRRIYGVSLLFIVLVGILALVSVLLFPMLQEQVTNFVNNFPSIIQSLVDSVTSWVQNIPYGEEIEAYIQESESAIAGIPESFAQYISSGFSGVSSIISSITSVVITLVTFPIVLFFLLKDERKFFRGFLTITPPKWREDILRISSEINTQVGAYLKGMLIIASSIGVMMFIGFTIIGLQYNVLLAIIAGFTSIIPYIGPLLAFLPALVVALIDSWWMVFQLILVWMVVQFIDGNLIEPNVMGKQLNVHPLTIVIVLLVMGDLLGLLGLIFGVPIYAILKVIVVFAFQQFKKRYNMYYGDVAGEYEVEPIEQAVSGENKPNPQLKRNIEIAKLKRNKEREQIEEEKSEKKESENSDK